MTPFSCNLTSPFKQKHLEKKIISTIKQLTVELFVSYLTLYELQGICLKLILKPFMVSPVPPAGRLLGGLTNCVVTLLLVTEHT